MSEVPDWWRRPRKITVVVDNDSWILPYAKMLVEVVNDGGDHATLCRSQQAMAEGSVAFYLGCTKITPTNILELNRRNLVVHASDLPKGRGFSPLTWEVIDGKNVLPVCLIDAVSEVDAGPIVDRQQLHLEGHELIDEMRSQLGQIHVSLCKKFLDSDVPVMGEPQHGTPTYFKRRQPIDSCLDPDRPLADQFDLLRTVDNRKYPALLNIRGHQYKLTIEKVSRKGEESV